MKVRLKLTLDELKALIVIFVEIMKFEPISILRHIDVLESENILRKLTPKLFEAPKKRYTVVLNSAQILALMSNIPYEIGRFEHTVYLDICAKIDKQYISEAHHRKCRTKALGGKSYITLLD